jgi:chemotaxis signal transduction protein
MAEVQFVVFKLGNEENSLNIMKFQEIGQYEEQIKMPKTPTIEKRVNNLISKKIKEIKYKKK